MAVALRAGQNREWKKCSNSNQRNAFILRRSERTQHNARKAESSLLSKYQLDPYSCFDTRVFEARLYDVSHYFFLLKCNHYLASIYTDEL